MGQAVCHLTQEFCLHSAELDSPRTGMGTDEEYRIAAENQRNAQRSSGQDIEEAVSDSSIFKMSREELAKRLFWTTQQAGSGPRAKKLTDYVPLIQHLIDDIDRRAADDVAAKRHNQVVWWTRLCAWFALIAAAVTIVALVLSEYRNRFPATKAESTTPQRQSLSQP
jgi:hypothetical protein